MIILDISINLKSITSILVEAECINASIIQDAQRIGIHRNDIYTNSDSESNSDAESGSLSCHSTVEISDSDSNIPSCESIEEIEIIINDGNETEDS